MFLKKLFIDTLGIFLIICFFAFTFKTFFNIQSPYLITYVADTGIKITYYDYGQYFIQVSNSFNTFGAQLQLEFPWRTWQTNMDLTNWLSVLMNNIAFIFDWMYMPINIALWVLRLMAWIIKSALVILGFIEFANTPINGIVYQPEWFMTTLTWMSQNLSIPYI